MKLLNAIEVDSMKFFRLLLSSYITLMILIGVSSLFDVELDKTAPFMIGEATAEGVNVTARISNFYRLLLVGITAMVACYFLLDKLLNNFLSIIRRRNELVLLISLQLVLSVLNFFSDEVRLSTDILNLSIVLLFLIEIVEFFKPKRFEFLKGESLKSMLPAVVAMSISIENIFITSVLIVLLVLLLQIDSVRKKFQSIIVGISALPLLVFLVVESTLILNQNGMYALDYWMVGLIVLAVLFVVLFLVKLDRKSISTILFKWQMPLLLIGLTLFNSYAPTFTLANQLFEPANNLNPIMMSEIHQTTFFIDYISSHLLNDVLWMKLYVMFNGYHNDASPLIYYGFSTVLYVLAIYYFLVAYFKNAFGVVVFILFSPYLFFIISYNYAFGLLPALFLFKYIGTRDVKFLWWLGISATLSLFWRLDVGIANIGASLIIFVLLFVLEKGTRKSLIKIGSTLGVVYGGMLALYYVYCQDLIKEAIHYFSGSQGHGLSTLTEVESNLFYVDYYILPLVIGFLGVVLLLNLRKFKQDQFVWVILFLIGFYFFNFQRGLVRHSFMELNEAYVTSFGWLILLLIVLRFISKRLSFVYFGVIVLMGMLFSIHSFSKSASVIDQGKMLSVNNLPKIEGKKVERSPMHSDYKTYTKPAVDFLRSELKGDETFFDFSNSPLLYYYSEKRNPAFFSQSLQYIVDLYLQDGCVERIKEVDFPLVVFNKTNESFGDKIDGIPNKVRYYHVASHLLSHYKPAKEYGQFHLWEKGSILEKDTSVHFVKAEYWSLGLMPYYWKTNKNEPELTSIRKLTVNEGNLNLGQVAEGDFLMLRVNSPEDSDLVLKLNSDEGVKFHVNISLKQGEFEYKFPICGSYYLRKENNPSLEVVSKNGITIIESKMLNQSFEH